LQHQWADGADEDGLADAVGAVAAEEAGYFATAGGVANHADVLEIKVFEESIEVVGVGVWRAELATEHYNDRILRKISQSSGYGTG
jgi:hypothetical protein